MDWLAVVALAMASLAAVVTVFMLRERHWLAKHGLDELARLGSLQERQRNLVGPAREDFRETLRSIEQVGQVLRRHIEETDPTIIPTERDEFGRVLSVGKVLLPEPMYSDFLERAAGAPPTRSTRMLYDDWVRMQVPPYEEWMVRVYPQLKLGAELAGELGKVDLPATPAKEEERPESERPSQKSELPN